jgi:hypothetical protein
VVVTRARLAQGGAPVDLAQADRARVVAGEAPERLERLGDVRPGELGLAAAAGGPDRDEPRRFESREMAADRRRRDAHADRERAGRQRRPGQQLFEHAGAGAVGDRGGDIGEGAHAASVRARRFGGHRNVARVAFS